MDNNAQPEPDYDIAIIGGGINGAGVARDAAQRGLKVYLCEKDDFAAHTSSWSTKLIHGGLRYLEYYEFRLVREALNEREVLLNLAPHLIKPMRFILPHHKGLRPRWMLRLGLFLYDNLGVRKSLEGTRTINLKTDPLGACLNDDFKTGFEYSDCQVDDSRLVIANIMDAHKHGATIEKGTAFVGASRAGGVWAVRLKGTDGTEKSISAKIVVNAAGPWVNAVLDGFSGAKPRKKLRLVKGSHIITKRLYPHDRAYIFQNADNRIIFAIPYVNDTTLIGTTDIVHEGDPASAAISEEETQYLCDAISEYLAKPVTRADVVSTYSGVRPLYDELGKKDASAVTRDYAFDIDEADGVPLLSIYGGKLTTYRKLAEHVLDNLEPWLSMRPTKSKKTPLAGGDIRGQKWPAWVAAQKRLWPYLPDPLVSRLANTYGSDIAKLLEGVKVVEDLGTHFGASFYQTELDYLVKNEWVHTAEDALTRRTKLAQIMTRDEIGAVAAYLGSKM